MERKWTDTPITLSSILIILPLLAILVTAITFFVVLQQRQDAADKSISKIETKIDDIQEKTNQMARDIAVIKSSLDIRIVSRALSSTPPASFSTLQASPSAGSSAIPQSTQQSQSVVVQSEPKPEPQPTPTPIETETPSPSLIPSINIPPIIGITLL